MLQKNWVYKDFDNSELEKLIEDAGVSRALAKVFVSRGMLDCDQVKEFLQPDVKNMHDPFLMDGMEAAVRRILKAIEDAEDILVYGDYDVDGVTGTSILYHFLDAKGARVQYFIPDRMEDGYGLTMSSVEKVKEFKVSLVITVDCGITSVDEAACLKASGMDAIVTDHHECRDILPEAVAVLNPHKPGCGYPFKELCGAGVVLKLVQAMCIRLNCRNDFADYMDLAALATIADMVALKGENRIIASLGLKAMETTKNIGLGSLIRVAGFGDKPVSSYHVAFGLAPRVNAAGRLGSAIRSVRLFTTDNLVVAETLAKELDSENKIRQDTENDILKEAIAFVEQQLDPVRERVLVISGKGWHHGVIGIVASKVLERYNRPCIMISIEEGVGKGSARSISGLNLFQALSSCEDLLDRFGGHEMAAGLTIQADKISELRKRMNEYAEKELTEADLLPCVRVDAFLEDSDITIENARELAQLAPYGLGNPGPVFGYTALSIGDIKALSAGKHLKLRLKGSGGSIRNPLSDMDYVKEDRSRNTGLDIEAIGFNMGGLCEDYKVGDVIDAVFALDINSWNGSERLQLNLKDVKTCIYIAMDKNIVFNSANDYNRYYDKLLEFYSLQGYCHLKHNEIVPERNEFEAVYKYIRSFGKGLLDSGVSAKREEDFANNGSAACGSRIELVDLFDISRQVAQKFNLHINYFKLKKILEIFRELQLLSLETLGGRGVAIVLSGDKRKVDLKASALYKELQGLKQRDGRQ